MQLATASSRLAFDASGRHRDPGMAIRRCLRQGGPVMVFQPQFSLSRLEIAGYEALARFPGESPTEPEQWFALAHEVRLGAALEASAFVNAIAAEGRPAGTSLAINLSPSVLGSQALRAVLPLDLTGVEIELTEHEIVLDPEGLRREVDRLRARGARLAIDDVGAGHSGLRRVMELAPDSLKLDRHLVDGVADNGAKAALIRAVVEFAHHIGAVVCAEGVERVRDLLALADLDVGYAQGWVVGRPDVIYRDADSLVFAACARSLQRVLATAGSRSATGIPNAPAALEDLLGQISDVRSLPDLARLARSSAAVLDCDHVELSFLHPDETSIETVQGAGDGDDVVYSLDDYPATRRCLSERIVIPVYRGPDADPAEIRLLDDLGYRSVLLVPVSSRGRAIGLFECHLTDDVPWSRRQIRSARLLAAVLGPVLDGLRIGSTVPGSGNGQPGEEGVAHPAGLRSSIPHGIP